MTRPADRRQRHPRSRVLNRGQEERDRLQDEQGNHRPAPAKLFGATEPEFPCGCTIEAGRNGQPESDGVLQAVGGRFNAQQRDPAACRSDCDERLDRPAGENSRSDPRQRPAQVQDQRAERSGDPCRRNVMHRERRDADAHSTTYHRPPESRPNVAVAPPMHQQDTSAQEGDNCPRNGQSRNVERHRGTTLGSFIGRGRRYKQH